MYTSLDDMPFRLTTREVAAVLRISVPAFTARRRDGRYKIEPVERSRECLYDRRDVLRLLGRDESELRPTAEPDDEIDPWM